ncbi:cytochrome b pre-mRNA-processing protein 3 [Novosphingobium sp. PhB165]|uniref:ubiquinol-cytochrome C chaperone family protein n=1 Tax=Novosphingobium sp. PhB165 TaxID=2485105 RepID=UPI00104752DA|nr:ubiquinol-cytochrome C chaperone family protein [Novosphingobium sp. PhB165]TCM17356.1 cytochrome b pre-mRNA-processing protein 3 [Novosphingobium sp. PhB165]
MTLLSRLIGKHPDATQVRRDAVRPLWHRVVEIAREKPWYAEYGVADSVGGRFDAVTLVLAIVILRMERDDALIDPAARLTELFVSDMDGQLRQSGVGDLVVGKHMGKLMSALGGRIGALREAFPEGDAALAQVLERNVTLREGADAAVLVAPIKALAAGIDALSAEDLLAARIPR